MQLLILIITVAITGAAKCGLPYRLNTKCCHAGLEDCEGPCWNEGCETKCQTANKTLSCPGTDNYYACCPTNGGCISNVTASKACCNKDFNEVLEMTDFVYDMSRSVETPDSTSSQLQAIFEGENYGNKPQDVGKVDKSVKSTQTTGWSFESSTTISALTTFKTGIPHIVEGEISVGLEQMLSYGDTASSTKDIAVTISSEGNTVSPFSRQVFAFKSTMKTFNVPFTATASIRNQCGDTSTTTIQGHARVSGVASFSNGDVSKIIGPPIPISCESPFDTPISKQYATEFCPRSGQSQCQDNALCVRYQIHAPGNKCCDPADPFSCCAVAKAHSSCITAGFKPTDILCPSKLGAFHQCCYGASRILEDELEEVKN